MLIIRLCGGLGNQMFQYACAQTTALRLGTELKLDISFLQDRTPREDFTYRDFELNVFQINNEIATKKEVQQFLPYAHNASAPIYGLFLLKRVLRRNYLFREPKQKQFQHISAIDKLQDDSYIQGYFQSEKYFVPQKNEILKAFALKNKIDFQNQQLIDKISAENAVSIHIRRGDYQHKANSHFNLLDISYYLKAIDLIRAKIENPVFYIFTEDHEWAKKQFEHFTIVNINKGEQSHMDMILMSCCKHNIIANSSFSWWGAWLNRNEEKIVIAPQKWFADGRKTYDLIPTNWIKL
ncbi:alpha-1,2-fucosyltransferase [Bacteroidia bacterium]|nr:alpha-1,2-fucosyltransferase [Bacteroidia bacterium]